MLRPCFSPPELSLLKVAHNHRGKQLIHTLFIRHLRVSPAPYKEQEVQEFEDGLFEEEFHLLVGAFNIFVDFF